MGDAALAAALAAVFYQATGVHYEDRRVGIALILLQTLPLAVRRRYPLWVLAVVTAGPEYGCPCAGLPRWVVSQCLRAAGLSPGVW